jgi:hypothetical protein
MKNVTDKKKTKLEQFKLFYESIPAPDYLQKAEMSSSPKPKNFSERRIARRKK